MDLVSQQLVLLALEGCSTAEISEITGLTPTNVTTRLSRLRQALTKEEESP
jgi:DNA-directed RNA polymerase specialized sigma24 family protein